MKPIPPTDTSMTFQVRRDTLSEVERDEAEAISLLVRLLDKVRETSHVATLDSISKVVIQWQNQPPGVIVRSLMKVAEQFEEECRIRAKG